MKLTRHPLSPRHEFGLGAEVTASDGELTFRFTATGGIGAILVAGPDGRADGLWQSTCFEAFIRGPGDSYAELNFAPSGGWAAFRFDDYRLGRRDLPIGGPPRLGIVRGERELVLTATLALPAGFGRKGTPLGLSAILEDDCGTKSYWALAHPDGDPDFHHPDCFAAKLP